MKILVTGSTGLIGSHLIPFLETEGHIVHRLVRNKDKVSGQNHYWDPDSGLLEKSSIDNYQIVIHLAGENISSHRWSQKQKAKILNSRIQGTRLLVDRINQIQNPPKLFISASAIGYYGDRGSELLTETSQKGHGFLSDVVRSWESEADLLKSEDIRKVFIRSGVVLSRRGGALTKTLLPFKLGIGTIIGKGNQYMSWISVEDLVQAINFIIKNKMIEGPVNMVSPEPVTNYQYSKSLGKVLSRPVVFKIPSYFLKAVLGEMAVALLLSSSRVIPQKLIDHGYNFLHPTIDEALKAILTSK